MSYNPFAGDDNSTPLMPDERNGLKLTYITLRHELNEAEANNILQAEVWAFARRRDVVDEGFLKRLHEKMFREVWRWAGKYRTTERNLGIALYQIQTDMRQLIDDVRYWIENQSYEPDEIAVRFHHRLVFIHPFPNGNGRWSRLASDLLIVALGGKRFTWGSANLQDRGTVRRAYITALHAADEHDPRPLIAFARS
jgi:Fic-DOC domain mobile mystery protein B